MFSLIPFSRRGVAVGLGLAALLTALACREQPSAARVDTYTVHGVVRQLPAGPAGEILIRHEELPDFKDASGAVVGMKAMAMPFPLATPDLASGLAVGDPVEMTFEVRWQGDGTPLRVVALRKTALRKTAPREIDEAQ